jgi:phosphatidylserine decarboxylase
MNRVQYRDRRTGRTETEPVYGERWIRFLYEHPLGAAPLHLFARRTLFSRWYGGRMDHPRTAAMVAPFIARYGLDAGEFADPPESFTNFNAFFARKLRPEARPIAASDAVFPADGRHFGFARASEANGFFVKGHPFDLARLLGDAGAAAALQEGGLVLSRLCPTDYHRFHFPVAGTPSAVRHLPGPLFSVSPIALARRPSILFENRRAVLRIDSTVFGRVTVVLIGATCVGTIRTTHTPGAPVRAGDELGTFLFGGSAMATLFEPGRVRLADDLIAATRDRIELYARMGEALGDAA